MGTRTVLAERGAVAEGLRRIKFVDLCAGLGGFHLGLTMSALEHSNGTSAPVDFECVMAAEIDSELRCLYVKNFPNIEVAYGRHNPRSRVTRVRGIEELYEGNRLRQVHGDIRELLDEDDPNRLRRWPDAAAEDDYIVPEHDLLCAGFPCQPFSKSGAQRGFDDLNGTVFKMLAVILKHRRPGYVFLENVGNFERHDGGNTWKRVREVLEGDLGYSIRFTGHVGGSPGARGLLSPHDHGYPHHRQRFFILCQRGDMPFAEDEEPFPQSWRKHAKPAFEREQRHLAAARVLQDIIDRGEAMASAEDLAAARLSSDKVACIAHWNRLLEAISEANTTRDAKLRLPSFPIWGYELDPWQHYPVSRNPSSHVRDYSSAVVSRAELVTSYLESGTICASYAPRGKRAHLSHVTLDSESANAWILSWPGYARSRNAWPNWKVQFIESNRAWAVGLWRHLDNDWLRAWLDDLSDFPPSFQKLEWNCQGEEPNLWRHILQFRPSGLRVKRFRHVPALVAMTTTQLPIVPVGVSSRAGGAVDGQLPARHLLPREALELQGFPPDWATPRSRELTFRALGNAVHAGLVSEIVKSWLLRDDSRIGVGAAQDRDGQTHFD